MEGTQIELLFHPTTDEPYIRASDLIEMFRRMSHAEDVFMLADRDAYANAAAQIDYIAKNAVRRPGPVYREYIPYPVAYPVFVPVFPLFRW